MTESRAGCIHLAQFRSKRGATFQGPSATLLGLHTNYLFVLISQCVVLRLSSDSLRSKAVYAAGPLRSQCFLARANTFADKDKRKLHQAFFLLKGPNCSWKKYLVAYYRERVVLASKKV